MAEEVDISEQTTHLCSLSHFSKTPCSLVSTSDNPSKLIYLKECKKSVSNHLRSLNISYDENILTEGLLICLRVGIFRLMPHFTVCPYHRSSLGLNWKRKTSCVFPGHTGKSKGDRPISYRTSYALISQRGTFLPIGSAICKVCKTKTFNILDSFPNMMDIIPGDEDSGEIKINDQVWIFYLVYK
ncbi:unnamed protein product [Mytilus coruscus]|uniref:Uncharacterized protein n=1 Tax=Mytilus coruscus TaxID=42192 RepID=A0A6J8EKX3_MYTCO|nr:unnamed protein product [Mytilus coruscus]